MPVETLASSPLATNPGVDRRYRSMGLANEPRALADLFGRPLAQQSARYRTPERSGLTRMVGRRAASSPLGGRLRVSGCVLASNTAATVELSIDRRTVNVELASNEPNRHPLVSIAQSDSVPSG